MMMQRNTTDTAAAVRRCQAATGRPGLMLAGAATLGVAALLAVAPARAQMPANDTLYDTHATAGGACNGMDWHVIVHPDKTINGVVGWDGFRHIAHLSGTVGADGSFKANAVEPGSNKTDTVSGTLQANDLKASINGTGTPCDNQTMAVPLDSGGMAKG